MNTKKKRRKYTSSTIYLLNFMAPYYSIQQMGEVVCKTLVFGIYILDITY
jgi:hypothetical protein